MKENFKLFGIITFAVIISLMTAGCSDKDADDGTSKLTGTVTIQGTAQAGQMITANTNNLGGSGTIRYQWKRGDTSSAAGTNISSAVSSTYSLTTADVGKYIKVTVTRSGNSGSITSAATAAVQQAVNFNGVTWTNTDLGASTFQKTAKNGPYDIEMWNENRQGTASMTLGVNGAYKCSWDGINNVLFRAGRKYPTDNTNGKTHSAIGTFTIEYTATFNPGTVSGSSNSYLSVYGWVTGGSPDALIEYYIIESKGEYNPGSGQTQVGSDVTIDGGTYKLYKVQRTNAPSIEGNKDFMQYFSVRTSNRTSGTISVSQHFAAWNSAGLTSINNGKLYEVSLKAESYGGTSGKSKGSAEITKNILKVNGTEIQ